MADNTSLLRAAAHPMNTDGVTPLAPTVMCRAEKCEFAINIGLFFDGTGNNQYWAGPEFTGGSQLQRKKDSNVARLFRAYPDKGLAGFYPYYIPGVGTPFDKIGENDERALGMGFGAGGDARIVFGLLMVLNTMHRSILPTGSTYLSDGTILALCRNGWLPIQTGNQGDRNRLSPVDQAALDQVGMKDRGRATNLQRHHTPHEVPPGPVCDARAKDQ